jgi:uncharacterized repeat protein (TIGR01451 family)
MRKLAMFERFLRLVGLVVLLLASVLWIPTPVVGQGPEDRPTIPPPTATSQPVRTNKLLPSLHGTIINWGFRREPTVLVQVNGTDWHLDTTSDAAGYYLFERLGNDVAWLNVVPHEGSNAKPLTTDVAVRPAAGDETVVNLGVYEGQEPLPLPVTHTMEASTAQARPGDRVTFTVHVKNNLRTPITHVQLTNHLPEGLSFVSADSNHGPVDCADRLVVARLGDIAPSDEAEVTIVTLVEPRSDETRELTNRSSLLYRESVVTQATVAVTVSGGPAGELPGAVSDESSAVLPVTGTSLPLAGVGLGALLLALRGLRTHLARQ